MADPIVILGAGHAGVAVAAGLRTRKWDGPILLVEAEDTTPYERPPLSKDVLSPDHDGTAALLRKGSFYTAKDVELVTDRTASAVDRARRQVLFADGTVQPYHRLVIATGSRARRFAVPGADLPGVHSLRTQRDAAAIADGLVPGNNVVIVGAGYIGMEVAAAAAKRGCSVTVLEFQDRVMKRVTSAPVSQYFQDLHREYGTEFVFGAAVTALEGDEKVERVITSAGDSYPADLVVVGIGVQPNDDLAAAAGIECADGILVDEDGRTSDPEVYAAGDVTRSTSPLSGNSQRLECIQNAQAQADAVADHLTGRAMRTPEVPWFWTVQHGVRLQTAGVLHPDDAVVLRGDPADGAFCVVYLREGRLVAIDTVGSLADFRTAKKLIARRAEVDPHLVADPAFTLEDAATLASTPATV